MKIGSEEWLRKLNENYAFPCKISFVLVKESDNEVLIISKLIKNKSQVKNVKFANVYAATWTSQGSAVLSVKEFNNAYEYLKEAERLNEIWGFALKKPDAPTSDR